MCNSHWGNISSLYCRIVHSKAFAVKTKLLLCLLLPLFTLAQQQYYPLQFSRPDAYYWHSVMNKRTLKTLYVHNNEYQQIEAQAGDTLLIRPYYNQTQQPIDTIVIAKYMLQDGYKPQGTMVVQPITNKAYRAGYQKQNVPLSSVPGNNLLTTPYKMSVPLYFNHVKHVSTRDNEIIITPLQTKRISLGIVYSSSFAVHQSNRQPAVQSSYVQGRSVNNQLQWRGPETAEVLSYGPAAATLAWDGSNYMYDHQGRLSPIGPESNQPFQPYQNQLLQSGHTFNNYLCLNGVYIKNGSRKGFYEASYSRKDDRLIIGNYSNNQQRFAGKLGYNIQKLQLVANYAYIHLQATGYNNWGYFNKLYRDALLTPNSFSNNQNSMLPSGQQRSFSPAFNNPYFLIEHANMGYQHKQQSFSATATQTFSGGHEVSITESYSTQHQYTPAQYPIGTANFLAGATANKKQHATEQQLTANAFFRLSSQYRFPLSLSTRYMYAQADNHIRYNEHGNQYQYNRTTHETVVQLQSQYSKYAHTPTTELAVALNSYHSSTSNHSYYFLPTVKAGFGFNTGNARFKASFLYNYTVKEPAITTSYAYASLTRLNAENANQYFPSQEAATLQGLEAVGIRSYEASLEATINYNFVFTANYFIRKHYKDVFPTMNNGEITLANAADHTTKGFEFTFFYQNRYRYYQKNPLINLYFSFVKYNNTVKQLYNNNQSMVAAGFSNVYNALIPGQATAVIVGSTFMKDNMGNTVIGNDGFPIVAANNAVIGNPNPNFIIKWGSTWQVKRWTLQCDLEWKNGGDRWNGTQAALDYYGRSQTSAALRTTTGYVFEGVLQDGSRNNIPVNFYDVTRPMKENRWIRYGPSGVAEAYIQKVDYVRLRNLSIGYSIPFKKWIKSITVSVFASNILLWTPYTGSDPSQLLFDIPAATGLDYFNLPSLRSFGTQIQVKI